MEESSLHTLTALNMVIFPIKNGDFPRVKSE